MAEMGTSMKYFSGDDCDYREYRRWKQWAVNKMAVMDKLDPKARGSFVWTLLQGKALEVVEHLKESEYQCEGGDKTLFALLDKRWPEKDRSDEMGEHIQEVFTLKARGGESLRQWCARARECFDRCARKTGVDFPEEARGWILLQCSGMSEEQRAVVLARTQGVLKFDSMSQAMRSCFPDLVISGRKATSVNLVDLRDQDSAGSVGEPGGQADGDFNDVELFLHEFDEPEAPVDDEVYEEKDIAEILAVSWKDKRQELSKLKQSRNFHKFNMQKRSFRIEVEELKKRTRCRRCNQIGHWARECKNPPSRPPSSSSGQHHREQAASSVEHLEFGAGTVEHFVCAAGCLPPASMLDQLRAKKNQLEEPIPVGVALVSSPGKAVLDSGCGKTIIGEKTLENFKEILSKQGLHHVPMTAESNLFRFGNGACETSTMVASLPICLGGRRGVVKAAVVKGEAPLLLSRPAMKSLQATLDFDADQIVLFEDRRAIPLETNEAGQYTLDVCAFPAAQPVQPITGAATIEHQQAPESFVPKEQVSSPTPSLVDFPQTHKKFIGKKPGKDFWEIDYHKREIIRHHVKPRHEQFTPCHCQCPVLPECLEPHRVTVRMYNDQPDQSPITEHDRWVDPVAAHSQSKVAWTGTTTFSVCPEVSLPLSQDAEPASQEIMMSEWKPKQRRQLLKCLKECKGSLGDKYDVIEVFSPPRFASYAATLGKTALSADLITGWDFRKPTDRDRMKSLVAEFPPELLVLCPPCTWAGGWFHLNRCYMTKEEIQEKQRLTSMFVNFCCDLIEIQLSRGGRVLFEHPLSSSVWTMPRMLALKDRLREVTLDMCRYGLRIPKGLFIKKATQLWVSDPEMQKLSKRCPGKSHPEHEHHQAVAGHDPQVGSVSRFAGQYPAAFVRSVMRCIPKFRESAALTVSHQGEFECFVGARVRELNEATVSKMRESIRKLHVNLGHPGKNQLIRILKHGGANEQALELAKEFHCEQCAAHVDPSPPLPAKPDHVVTFNQKTGVDVKYLTGWKRNQKVAAVNILDYGSSMQLVVPIWERGSSETIRRTVQERWINWAGTPSEIIVDPAKPNIGEAMTTPLELGGSIIQVTAADAHHQLGKVEVHGGWFGKILDKIIIDRSPQNQTEWLECVQAAHCKNELIQVYGMTPAQHVFGRNPKVPENLMDEPVEVIPATASLYEAECSRRVGVRQAARRAVLELQDDRSIRRALAARPRNQATLLPGQYVAYWRSQKWQGGVHDNQGRWHGPGVVLGKVGRNYIIVHNRQVFRCAPEQTRPSTTEEKSLLRAPHAELIGIKALFEEGKILSSQYHDLASQEYPTEQQEGVVPLPNPRAEESQAPAVPGEPQSVLDMDVPMSAPANPEVATPDDQLLADGNSQVNPKSEPYETHEEEQSDNQYGPIRRRVRNKQGDAAMFRPSALSSEDFSDMMQEILPELMESMLPSSEPEARESNPSGSSASATNPSRKRAASTDLSEEPPAVRRATDEEVLQVDSCEPDLSTLWKNGAPIEVLLNAYLQKKASKEIPHVNQPPEQQLKIDEAKLAEWNTIMAKNAGELRLGSQAEDIRQKLSHRIMDSRYVVTMKQEEDSDPRVKARWCLLGHRDPDLSEKAQAGDLQSPTLSQVGRSVLFQVIASQKWQLALGDIKGAFLASGELPSKYRPLYARLPPGGIPGVPEDALIEVTGHVYGLNDSPSAWFRCLASALKSAGFTPCRFDPCLFTFREEGRVTGVYGIHVDDCATGGEGPGYLQALEALKTKFEFRKWRVDDGDFCGARYSQDPNTFEITMSQAKFCEKIRPLHLSRSRSQDRSAKLDAREVSCLRAINGSLNWLCTQSRPDLSTQVSFSQQSFPEPTVQDAVAANNAVRRAKQHADLGIVFRSIPLDKIAIMCHSDAAYANTKQGATQGGYVISFTHRDIQEGQTCCWTPAYWKSHRLPRVVNSTLSAEAQSMSCASSMVEWLSLFLTEVIVGPSLTMSMWNEPQRPPCILLTDCKSLYDHISSPSSPTLDDRRTSIDVIIIKEAINRMQAKLRWIPTDRMLADSMTKEHPDAIDLLRACVRTGRYQISPEATVLMMRANERARRKQIADQRHQLVAFLVSYVPQGE